MSRPLMLLQLLPFAVLLYVRVCHGQDDRLSFGPRNDAFLRFPTVSYSTTKIQHSQ